MNEPPESISDTSKHELADAGLAGDRIRTRWKSIIGCTVLGVLVAAAYTFVRRAEYAAHMSVFFPSRSSVLGTNGVMDASQGPSAAMLGSGPSPLRVFQAFLESETAIQAVSAEFRIPRQKLIDHRAMDSDPRTSVLTVNYVDPDPERAKRVLDRHIDELRKINAKVSFDTMEDDLKVLQSRLEEARQKMRRAEASLVNYEKTSISAPTIAPGAGGIAATPGAWAQNLVQLELDEQKIDTTLAASRSRVRVLSKLSPELPSELPPVKRLRPRLLDLEYELEVRKRTLGPEAPEVQRVQAQVDALRNELSEELRAYLKGVNEKVIDPSVPEGEIPALLTSRTVIEAQISVLRRLAAAAPAESMNMNRLYAQINLESGVVQQLTNQYLMASLQSARDPNRWVILDEPWVEDRPVNKSYGRSGLVGGFLGLFVGIVVAVSRRLPSEA